MRWTVVWTPEALDELARIWTRSMRKNTISQAADRIDEVLRFNPGTKGQSSGTNKTLLVSPLAVSFQVIPGDVMVRVYQVVEETN